VVGRRDRRAQQQRRRQPRTRPFGRAELHSSPATSTGPSLTLNLRQLNLPPDTSSKPAYDPMASSPVAPAIRSLTVLFFASAQDAVGGLSSLSLTLSSSSSTLPHLAELLAQKYPALGRVLRSSSWAVNEVMVGEEEVEGFKLKEGDVVAVLPPVSGG